MTSHAHPPKLLLFDLDGTLLRTHGAGMRAMARAGVMVFGESFTFDGISAAGGLDPLLLAAAAQKSGHVVAVEHHEQFKAAYMRVLPEELEAARELIQVMPGVVELLDELHADPRVSLGLLTGNYASTGPIKLVAAGIDPAIFEVTAFGDEAETREQMVPVALRRYADLHGAAPPPQHVAIIGDTPRDIDAARANHCTCFAVATGPYTVAELEAAGAHHALPDLSDPTPIRRFVEAR